MKDAVTVLKMTSRLELKDSISKTELQNKRISKNIFTSLWVYYNKTNYTP